MRAWSAQPDPDHPASQAPPASTTRDRTIDSPEWGGAMGRGGPPPLPSSRTDAPFRPLPPVASFCPSSRTDASTQPSSRCTHDTVTTEAPRACLRAFVIPSRATAKARSAWPSSCGRRPVSWKATAIPVLRALAITEWTSSHVCRPGPAAAPAPRPSARTASRVCSRHSRAAALMPASASSTSASPVAPPSPSDRTMIVVSPWPTESWSSAATRDRASARFRSCSREAARSAASLPRRWVFRARSRARSTMPQQQTSAKVVNEASASAPRLPEAPAAPPRPVAAAHTAPTGAAAREGAWRPSE